MRSMLTQAVVAAGEMMVGPKNTLLLDEISTGLDSSTTFLIVKSLRNYVHMQQATIFMALLQPQPETYELADDIFLLAEGNAICRLVAVSCGQ